MDTVDGKEGVEIAWGCAGKSEHAAWKDRKPWKSLLAQLGGSENAAWAWKPLKIAWGKLCWEEASCSVDRHETLEIAKSCGGREKPLEIGLG